MKISKTSIEGCLELELEKFDDNRGSFIKVFSKSFFDEKGIPMRFHEIFHSISKRGVIRGMHFQIPPHEQDKIVYPIRGEILDVALDLRRSSKTFGKYVSVKLSDENKKALFIPAGFAHGFQALSDDAIVGYHVSSDYAPKHDRGVRFDSFGMEWAMKSPVVSDRDLAHPGLAQFDSPF